MTSSSASAAQGSLAWGRLVQGEVGEGVRGLGSLWLHVQLVPLSSVPLCGHQALKAGHISAPAFFHGGLPKPGNRQEPPSQIKNTRHMFAPPLLSRNWSGEFACPRLKVTSEY